MAEININDTLLVPVDFTSYSEEALQFAGELAGKLKARLLVLHVIHDPEEAPGFYSQKGKAKKYLVTMEDAANEMIFFGKPPEAVRVATSHVLFKVFGVLIIVPFIGPFAKLVVAISPSPSEGLTGVEAITTVLPRQIANAHTLFNVGIAVLFLPFVSQFARLVYRLVQDRPIEETKEIQPKYLNELLIHMPSLALDAARYEIKRMGKRIDLMHTAMMPAVLSGDDKSLMAIRDMHKEIDILYRHLVHYLAKISQLRLNEGQTIKLTNLMAAVNDLDHIADLMDVNMVELGQRRLQKGFTISEQIQVVIETLHVIISDALKAAIRAVVEDDKDYAKRVLSMNDNLSYLIEQANLHQVSRLVCEDSGKFDAYSVEVDIIEKLKRIYYHSRRIARTVVDIGEEITELGKAA